MNRKTNNKYSLEHVKGHHNRTARVEDLLLEAGLNVECEEMAKDAVRGSMTRELRDNRQQLPLEKVCMFIAGMNQTLDPNNNLKRQIGTVHVKAYYISRGETERRNGRRNI